MKLSYADNTVEANLGEFGQKLDDNVTPAVHPVDLNLGDFSYAA